MQSESQQSQQFPDVGQTDDDLKRRLTQLLPPRPRIAGLRCGRNNVRSFLPLRSIPKQFKAGAHRTLDPPLLHYGWHFEIKDLERITEKRGFLVRIPCESGLSSDDDDWDSEEEEDAELSLDAEARRARAEERAAARKAEKARRTELSKEICNDMDVDETLRNVLGYLKERQLSVPCLRYRCVFASTRVMISIVSNYHASLAISEKAVQTLQEVFERKDKPVWDMDNWSHGWTYRSLRNNK
ncbi:hypothetical protein K435DRAFT_837965 [Dendrothele bispora CBS 962.96]|uniref:Uncharacterized protein n=1 Tax=Dendrothele bispora (strain CBS 962.96) TaxID=1314807 RepID=A0A4S8MA58_DENBC|nr:hypothetical protein K435DRAFT_837965 [Dendrothele bispora CBS 962.96]